MPSGTRLLDASGILPASRIFRYKSEPSYAGFANLFRYKLLHRHGGWWADMDLVCLRPFDFAGEHVFGSERDGPRRIVGNSVIRSPAGAPLIEAAWRAAEARDPEELGWGETGPRLLDALVRRFDLGAFVEPPATFAPLEWRDWRRVIEPGASLPIAPETRAVHLWNEMWRRDGVDKDGAFPVDSPYERWRRRFL